MACLALSLQPSNGSDILLQTREWFPPARALAALSAFRHTRLAFAASAPKQKRQSSAATVQNPHSTGVESALGDDPLAASSGQVVVGMESKYLVVYRLVNGIYVLGITTAEHRGDETNNVFECINTVNQAVNVVVAACRGVDVTPEKLYRKYPEVYLALDIVLRGVGAVRLAAILASIHGDSIAKMVHSGLDSESRVRGADAWSGGPEIASIERKSTLQAFALASFELPPEALAAGDDVAATIAPPQTTTASQTEESGESSTEQRQQPPAAEKDPFAASEVVNKSVEETLVGGFKKSNVDPSLALVGLNVTYLPPAAATKSTFVGLEGFEGEYGGIEFGNEDASLSEAFEGFDNAFGGGLDASEFVATSKKAAPKPQGLGGVELLLLTSQNPAVPAQNGDAVPLENLLVTKTTEMKGPEMFIAEEISVEFRESLLARVALQGLVYLRTLPIMKSDGKETEFSFKFENAPGVKRVAMKSSLVSSVGNGLFHVKTPPADEPLVVMKYSLLPKLTPIPLRVRLIQRHVGTLLSVMIQYASNPELSQPLRNVTFVIKLPVDPTLLTVSPKALLNREEKELRWNVPEIPLKGAPGKLRARMPVDQDAGKGEEIELIGKVLFSAQGTTTLSGVSILPAMEGKTDFSVINHRYGSKNYICN